MDYLILLIYLQVFFYVVFDFACNIDDVVTEHQMTIRSKPNKKRPNKLLFASQEEEPT